MNEFMVNGYKVIDLSKPIIPGQEKRRLQLRRYKSMPMGDFHTEIDTMSHLGTHVESPYHFSDNLKDILELPITTYLGRCVLLNLTTATPGEVILPKHLQDADNGTIREKDIVILDSPWKLEPFSDKTNTDADRRPYLSADTAIWLREKKVKAVGMGDGVSIEKSYDDVYAFHEILMSVDIVFIEVLKNLESLSSKVFFITFSALPISGLESCPVRAVAIEGIPEFC